MQKLTLVLGLGLFLSSCGGQSVATTTASGDGSGGDSDQVGGGTFVATIIRPNGTSSYLSGTTVTFEAEFFDNDRRVAPGTVSWSSSLKGFLGDTNPLQNQVLADGVHLVTVTATFNGRSASDSVQVTLSDFAVQISRPTDGSQETVGQNLSFQGTASTLDIATPVRLVSGNAGAGQRTATFAWTSSLAGAIGNGADSFAINSLAAGTHQITLTVTDNLAGGDGRAGTAAVSITVAPPNTRPTVQITTPATCPATLEQGGSLTLTATVTDPDTWDAGLAGQWTDLLTGETTSGDSATLSGTLALGKHALRFSATDTRGATATEICDVYVVGPGGSSADLFPSSQAINDVLPNTNLRFIGSDGSGYTFIGTADGLTILDANLQVTASYDGNDLGSGGGNVSVLDVAVLGSEAVIATADGLSRCDYAAGLLSNCAQVTGNQYPAVDATGTLAAAASDSGLLLGMANGTTLDPQQVFDDNNSNLPSNNVRDVLFVGSTLYVATRGGLCVVTDAAASLATPANELCATVLDQDNSILPTDEITALAYSGGMLWIGTSEGLVGYDPATGGMILYDRDTGLAANEVRDVVVDANGIVWVATNNGVSRLDPDTGNITNFTNADFGGATNDVRAIYIDAQGVKWFATTDGVVRYTGS
ncbi:MAG: hypothetical protein HY903_01000 [Deltaproteobacteria bacterium]|nr:hypothetical protein [Deltaproteobacteria bacterium]